MSTATNTRELLAPWFTIAGAFERMGVMEIAGVKHHPLILWFHSQTSLRATTDEVPWCSAFACAVMEMAGIKSPRSAAARDWLKWGCELKTPRIGCVVVFDRSDPTNKNAAHVAFYWGGRADDRIDVLGGNQSNKVCVAPYLKSDVIGYRWPSAEQAR
jgi:uncharacterized protein (TIGR02594 family)